MKRERKNRPKGGPNPSLQMVTPLWALIKCAINALLLSRLKGYMRKYPTRFANGRLKAEKLGAAAPRRGTPPRSELQVGAG